MRKPVMNLEHLTASKSMLLKGIITMQKRVDSTQESVAFKVNDTLFKSKKALTAYDLVEAVNE